MRDFCARCGYDHTFLTFERGRFLRTSRLQLHSWTLQCKRFLRASWLRLCVPTWKISAHITITITFSSDLSMRDSCSHRSYDCILLTLQCERLLRTKRVDCTFLTLHYERCLCRSRWRLDLSEILVSEMPAHIAATFAFFWRFNLRDVCAHRNYEYVFLALQWERFLCTSRLRVYFPVTEV